MYEESGWDTRPLLSVYFTDPNTGYAVGGSWGAIILKTTDGGTSWIWQAPPANTAWLSSVFFTDADTGYVVGSGIISKTSDGGLSWIEENSFGCGALSIYFPDANTGYAVGTNGTILKSSGGGGNPAGINSHSVTSKSLWIYPNPFSSSAVIEYELENTATVNLSVYNHLGQRVAVLVDEEQAAGMHQVQWDADDLPGGIYYFRLTANGNRLTASGKIVKY